MGETARFLQVEADSEPSIERVVFVCFSREVYEAYQQALQSLATAPSR